MSDTALPSPWLSIGEAAEYVGVSASTLRRWADAGRVPMNRTPTGHRRFRRRDLEPLVQLAATAGAA